MKFRKLIFIPILILFLPVIVYLSYSIFTGVFVFPVIYVDYSSKISPPQGLIKQVDISEPDLNTICKEAVRKNKLAISIFSGSVLKNLDTTMNFTEAITQTDLKNNPLAVAGYISEDGKYLEPSANVPISLINYFESNTIITCYYNLQRHKVDKLSVRVSSTLVGP